jgi:putative transposase
VGSEAFVTATKERLGFEAKEREAIGVNGSWELRESPVACRGIVRHENDSPRPKNTYFLDDIGYNYQPSNLVCPLRH